MSTRPSHSQEIEKELVDLLNPEDAISDTIKVCKKGFIPLFITVFFWGACVFISTLVFWKAIAIISFEELANLKNPLLITLKDLLSEEFYYSNNLKNLFLFFVLLIPFCIIPWLIYKFFWYTAGRREDKIFQKLIPNFIALNYTNTDRGIRILEEAEETLEKQTSKLSLKLTEIQRMDPFIKTFDSFFIKQSHTEDPYAKILHSLLDAIKSIKDKVLTIPDWVRMIEPDSPKRVQILGIDRLSKEKLDDVVKELKISAIMGNTIAIKFLGDNVPKIGAITDEIIRILGEVANKSKYPANYLAQKYLHKIDSKRFPHPKRTIVFRENTKKIYFTFANGLSYVYRLIENKIDIIWTLVLSIPIYSLLFAKIFQLYKDTVLPEKGTILLLSGIIWLLISVIFTLIYPKKFNNFLGHLIFFVISIPILPVTFSFFVVQLLAFYFNSRRDFLITSSLTFSIFICLWHFNIIQLDISQNQTSTLLFKFATQDSKRKTI